ncbi:unnamed protein product [Lathyrus sativus]|nr:unnamed protein product [Lathyrus sativus]
MKVNHDPKNWDDGLMWISRAVNDKGCRATLMRMVAAEMIYCIWNYINDIVFGNSVDNTSIITKIIDSVVYRSWQNRKLRSHLVKFMM